MTSDVRRLTKEMLQKFRNRRGQMITGELVVALFVAMVAISSMAVYVRRAYQGRIRDANLMALYSASQGLGNNVLREYEPYYANSASRTDAESLTEYKYEYGTYLLNEATDLASVQMETRTRGVVSNSQQMDPAYAD